MKVAIYARVSKDENHKDNRYQNPENQLRILRDYCKTQGFEIYREFVDKWSGADPNRPAFKEMYDLALKRIFFDAILVWKLDRFSREPMLVQMAYIQELKDRKIGMISITETWLNTTDDNPMSDLVIAIMSWAGAEERRKISERTRAGIERQRKEGTYKGGRPKGSIDSKPRKKKGYYLRQR